MWLKSVLFAVKTMSTLDVTYSVLTEYRIESSSWLPDWANHFGVLQSSLRVDEDAERVKYAIPISINAELHKNCNYYNEIKCFMHSTS